MRKLSAYEPGSPTAEQLQHLGELLDVALPAAHRWLATERPKTELVDWKQLGA